LYPYSALLFHLTCYFLAIIIGVLSLIPRFIFLNSLSIDITDVCMDESAVSSDPVVALLLDDVVVKDWCKRTFKNIVADLQPVCILQRFGLAFVIELRPFSLTF